ncbi:MAG: glycosyltransferase family 2 protein [Solirubrobacterales bacterium]|nr:glycosyltransferase family 2 protein [Solirubrobacterales bacterium]
MIVGLPWWVAWTVLLYLALVNSFYLVLLGAACVELRTHKRRIWHERRERLLGSRVAPRLSMLAPAFNEEATVLESVRSLLTLSYPSLEIIVINDGSGDATLDVLRREFDLAPIHPIYRRQVEHAHVRGLYRSRQKPGLLVVDKVNGGKADALNAGLDIASGELVCAMDADTLIEPDGLLRMVRPFLTREDIVAVGGTIRVANDCDVRGGRVVHARVPTRPLPGIQVVEYLRAFLFGRCGWNRLGGNLIVSGAFGLFRRDAVLDAGGYVHDTVGEDMELIAHLRRRGYEHGGPRRVEFVPDPVAWTEVPETLRVLGRQRDRWHRGLADVLWRHRDVALRPRYGSLGLFAYPVFVLTELLPPVLEIIGLVGAAVGIAVGALDASFFLTFALVVYGYGLVLNAISLMLEELTFPRYPRLVDRVLLVLWMTLENIGYRQLRSLWAIRGIVKYLRGDRAWGTMTRGGFALAPSEIPLEAR